MNSLVISGRLTSDPTKAMTPTGKLVARLAIACDGRKDKNGLASTFFIDGVAFGSGAEFILKYVAKGDFVALTGSLQHDTYRTREGHERSKWTILVNSVDLLKKNEGKKTYVKTDDDDLPGLDDPTPEAKISDSAKALEIDDDDLPF